MAEPEYTIEDYAIETRPDYPVVNLIKMFHAGGGPTIQYMRVHGPDQAPQVASPPTPYDTNMSFTRAATNERLAVIGTARIQPDVDLDRPNLSINVMALSAFPIPDWPVTFGSLNPEEPGDGVWVAINTPEDVKPMWINQTAVI